MKETITVVFSTNDNYAPMLGVAIHSLAKYASESFLYEIFVLTDGLTDAHQRKILSLQTENISIRICDITSYMKDYDLGEIAYFSKATYYRLLIDRMFPEHEKILYLDCDILVRHDVAELYQEDLAGAVLGVSRARLMKWTWQYVENELGLDPGGYFNAGVLLVNVPLFREYGIGEWGLSLLEKTPYKTADQDALNIICQDEKCAGKVKFLDGRWNVEWEHLAKPGQKVVIDEAREGTLEFVDDPYLIHYTTDVKPWNHPEIQLADLFWEEARETGFYEELLVAGAKNRATEQITEIPRIFARFCFPWDKVKPGEDIIIYGAGAVGRAFLTQMQTCRYANVVAVCDRDFMANQDLPLPVVALDGLKQFSYQKVLVAVEHKDVADEIIQSLLASGIDREKIVWERYK